MDALLAALVRGAPQPWPGPDTNDEPFLAAAEAHGVVPLIAWQQRRLGVLNSWPERLRARLAARARQYSIVEQLQRDETAAVAASLAAAGARPIVMKGAALAHTHYPHPCLRPREDFDLLIDPRCTDAAVAALRRRGYMPLDMVSGDLVTSQCMLVRDVGHGVRYACDLHWRISNRHAFASILQFDEIERRAMAIPALGDAAAGLSPGDALLLACLHRIAHHFDAPNLIWLYDIHLLASSLDPDAAAAVRDRAIEKGIAAICSAGLSLARRCFETVIPPALQDLEPAADEPLRRYLAPGFRPIDGLLSDLRAVGGPRERWRLLRQHLFPSADYMRASSRFGQGPLSLRYARRLVRGTVAWLRP